MGGILLVVNATVGAVGTLPIVPDGNESGTEPAASLAPNRAAVSSVSDPPQGPRKDYLALADALGATVLDLTHVRRSRTARLMARTLGHGCAQAWLAFR